MTLYVLDTIVIFEMVNLYKFGKSVTKTVRDVKHNVEVVDGKMLSIDEIDKGPHITPPPDGPVTLVYCKTTKGINICIKPLLDYCLYYLNY